MLDQRSQILLKTLIERYIDEGQPIGSRALSKQSGLDLSPATIRNIMADLEELGFIASPHTSAGRVPTPRGYRFFVDSLMTVQPLNSLQIQQMEGQMDERLQENHPQRVVNAAAQMLSEFTTFAGVVLTPKRQNPTFKHLEFIRLSERRILLVIVALDGDVQNRILQTERSYSPAELQEAANYFNQHCVGCSLLDVQAKLRGELNQLRNDMAQLMTKAVEVGGQALTNAGHEVVVSGENNLLRSNDLSANLENLRRLFDVFEQKTQLLQLLDVSQQAAGIQIYIGGESDYFPMDECSMVAAPYEVDGQVIGTLGVIGPMRMAYERVIPIVDITAKLLSSALTYQFAEAAAN